MRFFMGTGKYTPNAAISGDMGWVPPFVKQWKCLSQHWVRNIHTLNTRLNKRIFEWTKRKANNSCKNWVFSVKKQFDSLQLDTNFDMYTYVNKSKFIGAVYDKMMSVHIEEWKVSINRTNAIHGNGRNKLRTYRLFKTDYEVENYCKIRLPIAHRSAYAKFRCGVAPLKIETGRYEGLAENDRICPFCLNDLEDESHVILNCAMYQDIRKNLMLKAVSIDANFHHFNDFNKMKTLFSNKDLISCCAKTCFKILQERRNILYK